MVFTGKHVLIALFLVQANAKVVDFEVDGGAKAEDNSWETVLANGAALNREIWLTDQRVD